MFAIVGTTQSRNCDFCPYVGIHYYLEAQKTFACAFFMPEICDRLSILSLLCTIYILSMHEMLRIYYLYFFRFHKFKADHQILIFYSQESNNRRNRHIQNFLMTFRLDIYINTRIHTYVRLTHILDKESALCTRGPMELCRTT